MKKKTDSNEKQRLHDAAASPATTPRRRILKRLAAGGAAAGVVAALPTSWTQPVVESVVLPVHAQLSGEPDGDFFLSFVVERSSEPGTPGSGASVASGPGWLDWLVSDAHAGSVAEPTECFMCNVCARLRSGKFTATLNVTPFDTNTILECHEGSGFLGDTVSPMPVSGGSATCIAPGLTLVRLQGQAPARTLTVDAGTGAFDLVEDPNRTCSCSGLAGCQIFQDNCLLHGTPVLLPGGRSRSIEMLSPGDVVAALDHDTGTTKPAVVTGIVTSHVRDHYWRINDSLLITNDHPVLVASGDGVAWRRVDALAEGMEIQGIRGRTTIVSLERVMRRAETVYLETTADNFIAAPGGVSYVVKAGYGKASQRRRVESGRLVPA